MVSTHAHLIQLLLPDFNPRTRSRGAVYARQDRVELIEASEWHVLANVEGSDIYAVGLEASPPHEHSRGADPVLVSAWCTCPVAESYEPCKHLWATLVVAQMRGALGEASSAAEQLGVVLEMIEPNFDGFDIPLPPRKEPADHAATRAAADFLTRLDSYTRLAESDVTPTMYRHSGAELLFGIDVSASSEALTIRILKRTQRPDGSWSKTKAASLSAREAALAPEADRRLLAPILGAKRTQTWDSGSHDSEAGRASYLLAPLLADQWLPEAAAQNRLVLTPAAGERADELRFVRWEPEARTLRLDVLDDGRAFHLRVQLDAGAQSGTAYVLCNHRYLLAGNVLCPLRSAVPPIVAGLLNQSVPPVPHALADQLAARLVRLPVDQATLPDALRLDVVETTPVPVLQVGAPTPSSMLPLSIAFDYDGTRVDGHEQTTSIDATRRRAIRRHALAEQAAREWLATQQVQIGFDYRVSRSGFQVSTHRLAPLVRSAHDVGWIVEGEGARYRPAGRVRLSVSSGIDWLDLAADVAFDDQVAALADVMAAVRSGQKFVRLGDGSVGVVPDEWLSRYGVLAGAGDAQPDGSLRFTRTQAALLDALLEARADDAEVAVDEGFVRLRDRLTGFTRIKTARPPRSFKGTLRDYQREGLGWLQFLREFGFGGCLADDMGLGKTVMVLALLDWRRSQRVDTEPRPSLVVAPRSVIRNWMAEAERFAPGLVVIDASGPDRPRDAAGLAAADLVLATYGTVRRDILTLKDVAFDYVILDEAQAIKNAQTSAAKSVRLLSAQYRLALSGTPVENHLGELWSLFEFLNPGLLGRSAVFQKALRAAGPADGESAMLMTRALRPFMLRRTKQQVAPELPARTEQTLICELSKGERTLYEAVRKRYRTSLLDRVDRMGVGKSQAQILEALLRLRQAACHPALIDPARAHESSAKFDVLLEHLRAVVDEGHKALVFSQFTSLLDLFAPVLDRAGIVYESLDGRTRDRAERVERFQTDPACSVFLISLKAGGVGLNLTAAEYVFLLDPWWNPAAEAQAIDRAHRIGQAREVFAYRLIAEQTVEEKVLALQGQKRALAEAVFAESPSGLRGITRDDLEGLLG